MNTLMAPNTTPANKVQLMPVDMRAPPEVVDEELVGEGAGTVPVY